jgi:hypothetical protein
MIELTAAQHLDLQQHGDQPPRAHDPHSNITYILVREEVFSRFKNLLYDDSPIDTRESYPLVDEIAGKGGWDDPAMDVYNDFIPKRPS